MTAVKPPSVFISVSSRREPEPERGVPISQGTFMPLLNIDPDGGQYLFPASIWGEMVDGEAVYVAEVLCLPGCASQGSSKKEAKELVTSALRDILEHHRRAGTRPTFQEPDRVIQTSTLVNIIVNVPSA